MKKCPYCGLKINEDLLQCVYCNRELDKKQSAENIVKKCPYCAEEIQDDAIKCRYCGEWAKEIETIIPEIIDREPSTHPPEDEIPFDPALPRPWNRFWARSIDYTLFLFVYYLVVVVISMAEISLTFSDNILINGILNGIISLILVIAFLVFFESIWISSLSTTPGKALFGIRILAKSGEKLSYTDAVNRSFFVLLYGYALLFAFPVGTVITMWYSLKYINKNGISKWDEMIDCHVSHTKLDPWRYWSGVFVGAVMFLFSSSFLMINYGLNKTIFKEQARKQYKPMYDFDAWEKEAKEREKAKHRP